MNRDFDAEHAELSRGERRFALACIVGACAIWIAAGAAICRAWCTCS